MFKRVLLFVLIILVIVIGILLFNTFTTTTKQPVGEPQKPLQIDGQRAAINLSGAIKFATISQPERYNDSVFSAFTGYLKTTYPAVFAHMKSELFGKHALMLTWTGSNPDLKPIIFMGHQDVVPIEESSLDLWEAPPFSGEIKNGNIYGRGAIDDKNSVIGLLEASSALLAQNFLPERTVYFCFGADEEIGGEHGAKVMADHFREKNMTFEAIWDEGGMISKNMVPGITDTPVALIGIAEKGMLTVKLKCKMQGGHSSMPETDNAISVLSAAVLRLKNNPFPYKLSDPVKGFIDVLGPELPFVERMAFTNRFLMEDLIFDAYQKKASSRAMIHTTMAPTIFTAGIKENVMPAEAHAMVNLRILPGETVESSVDYLSKTINDERVEIEILPDNKNPSAVSNYQSEAFNALGLAVKDVYPEALVSPFLPIAATDSHHFDGLSENIYKFIPVLFTSEDLGMLHGANEHISISNFKKSIQVYGQSIRRWSTQQKRTK